MVGRAQEEKGKKKSGNKKLNRGGWRIEEDHCERGSLFFNAKLRRNGLKNKNKIEDECCCYCWEEVLLDGLSFEGRHPHCIVSHTTVHVSKIPNTARIKKGLGYQRGSDKSSSISVTISLSPRIWVGLEAFVA